MKNFRVNVREACQRIQNIDIEAKNEKEARDKVLSGEGDIMDDNHCQSGEWEIESIIEIK